MRDGRWSPPVNMGDSINTPGNEMAPFLYADGKTLVFSSDGRGGLGGKDLFISRKNRAGIWSKAQNMGLPVNSSYHDINLIYSLDGKTVWVSSDRNGKGYDIYKIPVYRRIKPFPVLFVNGRVIDSITGKSLNALVLVNDVISLKTIDSIKTDRKGSFLLVLDHAGKYIFDIAAPGYLPFSQTIVFKDTGVVASELHNEFRLKPLKKGETFVLRNVYFDLDRYSLTPASSVELNRLVAWLNENPNVHLFITGHTDNLGSKEHNKKLSEKRAYAVYHYLTNHGVDKKRLEYKGCGDENPLAPNDTEKNRRLNRRVEFKVQ
jgi:outer membrane protein OmpA-like peptidoglycan-associated protein